MMPISEDLTALIVIGLMIAAPLLWMFLRWMMSEKETEADPIADLFTKRKRDEYLPRPAARKQFVAEPSGIDWEVADDLEIRRFLAARRKINAIKRYRELTNCGLKEAKDAIDYLYAFPDAASAYEKVPAYDVPDAGIRDLIEAGHIEDAVEVYRQFAGVDEYTARDAVTALERNLRLSTGDTALTGPLQDPEIISLVRAGNKIAAIKRYRELTALGLQEAKEAIETVEKRFV